MEGPAKRGTPPTERKATRRRKLLVAIVVVIVATATTFVVWWLVRPRTIAEIYAQDHFQAGTQAAVQGTITGILWGNTSYGPRVFLQLDYEALCRGGGDVLGDPNATYTVGQSIQTVLHFQAYTINGDPAVWAPELACPFPSAFETIDRVVGQPIISPIVLVYNRTDVSGWTHYDIVTPNGDAYRADILPVVLRKSLPIPGHNPQLPAGGPVDSAARWDSLASLVYLATAGAYSGFSVVDRMASLTQGTSPNGTLRFADADGNGLLDDADQLVVRLPTTGGMTAWSTYFLQIGGVYSPGLTYTDSQHLIIAGPRGPLEILREARNGPLLDLRYLGDTYGATVTSRLAVTRVELGKALPLSTVRYSFNVGNNPVYGSLANLPVTLPNGATLTFSDANSDGVLDAGDLFTVGGVSNGTWIGLALSGGNASIGTVDWVVGYGQEVGRPPFVQFAVQGTNPWRIVANASFWSPQSVLGPTLRASLLENGVSVLTNVSVANGTIGTFTNGSLAFTDADGDGTLSTGDFFTLRGSSTDHYELDVSIFFAYPWRTYI